jgi:hypothetical protein
VVVHPKRAVGPRPGRGLRKREESLAARGIGYELDGALHPDAATAELGGVCRAADGQRSDADTLREERPSRPRRGEPEQAFLVVREFGVREGVEPVREELADHHHRRARSLSEPGQEDRSVDVHGSLDLLDLLGLWARREGWWAQLDVDATPSHVVAARGRG